MALPHFMYRDPCEVLESKQEHELRKSCSGCVYEMQVMFKSVAVKACAMDKKFGRRCRFYKGKDDGKNRNER